MVEMVTETEMYSDKSLNSDASYYLIGKDISQNTTHQGNDDGKIISASEGIFNTDEHDEPQQLDAVMYVVVVLAVYTSAIVILFVRYMHKGRDGDRGESTYYISSYYKNYISKKTENGNDNSSSRLYIDNPQIENKERLKTTEGVLKKLYGDNWMEFSCVKQAVTNAISGEKCDVVSSPPTVAADKKTADLLLSSVDDESPCKKKPLLQQNRQHYCRQLNSCCKNDKDVPNLRDINSGLCSYIQAEKTIRCGAELDGNDKHTYTVDMTGHLLADSVQQKENKSQDSHSQGEVFLNSNCSNCSSHKISKCIYDSSKSDCEFSTDCDDGNRPYCTCDYLGKKGNTKLQSSDSGFLSLAASANELRCENT